MKKQIQEFIAQNRQNIIDDWRDLVNMEGSSPSARRYAYHR